MSDFVPNRVTSGKSGAGRFDFKRNSEAEIDLVDEPGTAVLNDDLDFGDDDTSRAYLNPDIDFGDDDEDELPVTVTYDLNPDLTEHRDWRDDMQDEAPSIASTKEWNEKSKFLSEHLPLRKSPIADNMGQLDANLQEDAELIKAMDHRAMRFIGSVEDDSEFPVEYVDGLKERLAVTTMVNDRDKLRAVTSMAYDKIDELNGKIAKDPNSPYAAKWEREADAQRRTAITARAYIMRLNEEERSAE